jgi:CheY-like chemotaxis protein
MAARILVADDSVTIQKVVELTFSKEGFVLVQARSGEEAIQKAKAERPDLVLLDLVMPDKSGYEVCAALRADPALRAVPIILLTGTFEAFDKDKGTQAGANDFVTKPFESQVLISKVKKLLPARTAAAPPAAVPAAPRQVAPAKEAPRPAAAAAPAPASAPPRPTAPPAPPRGAAPGVMRGPVPPPPPPAAAPPRSFAPPPRAPAASVPPRPAPPVSPPPRAARVPDTPPRPERIPRAAEPPPPPAPPSPAPGVFGELSLEDLVTLPLPETGPEDLHQRLAQAAPEPPPAYGEVSLEAPSATPEPAPGANEPAAPEGLSLEGLLSAESAAAPQEAAPEPASTEETSSEPVFDLTSEMGGPSLPLVEVGAGEPPALSIEDLLASREPAPPEAVTAGVPEMEIELVPDSTVEETPAEAVPATPAAPVPPQVVPPVAAPRRAVPPQAAQPRGAPPRPAPARTVRPPVMPPSVPAAAVPPPPEEAPSPGEPEAPLTDAAAMRQAVTERVARALATDLSDKMLERIEQIVWDVVPEMAEILIAKEIEKIRALAEGKQPS